MDLNRIPLLLLHFFVGDAIATDLEPGSFSLKFPKTMEAEIGDTVILPCYTDPQTNVIRVEWMVNVTTEVHVYRKGNDDLYNQDSIYKGKTSVFKEELPKGNCSLQLVVSQSHFGIYKCSVRTSKKTEDSCVINLTAVSGKGPSPSLNSTMAGFQLPHNATIGVVLAVLGVPAACCILFWWIKKKKQEKMQDQLQISRW
ncbi:V-set domain containing T-cell activation inhibitor 1-like [Pundamilia nyererei]|uniref:V-set domain containing T-cell activation inhibitor 1-like n=1 Tax=Pundamilia nyererei TaxID=303518 RepID=A0A9Y6J5Q7_9CICH|nr:PREDICTED: V-set domain containing T-cell activation inhibitor 1-like [Pundamilia nyererei]